MAQILFKIGARSRLAVYNRGQGDPLDMGRDRAVIVYRPWVTCYFCRSLGVGIWSFHHRASELCCAGEFVSPPLPDFL